jgi:hypothetical protein
MWFIIIVPVAGFLCLLVIALKYDRIVPPISGAARSINSRIDRGLFRDDVIKMPVWIKFFFIFMVLMMAHSFSHFPVKFQAVKDFQKGKRYEVKGSYPLAAEAYLKSLEEYPESDRLNARIFVNYYKDGDIRSALSALRKLEGKELSRDVFNELNPIVQSIKSMILMTVHFWTGTNRPHPFPHPGCLGLLPPDALLKMVSGSNGSHPAAPPGLQ